MQVRVSLSGERPTEPAVRALAGVGLLRGEFLFRDLETYVTDAGARAELTDYVSLVCGAFAHKPVWYRLSDFWSDEANVLQGNDYIVDETNPMLGIRGIRRALARPEEFSLEVEAVACVARQHAGLGMLLPFVQDGDEMREASQLCRRAGWPGRLGSMLEIPSAVLDVKNIIKAGATNLLVGLNDLTCLLLGRERGSNELKLNSAVWKAISMVGECVDGTEWGIAGSISRDVVERARAHRVPYTSVHYEDLPAVLGTPVAELADLSFVRRVKDKTRAAKRRRVDARR